MNEKFIDIKNKEFLISEEFKGRTILSYLKKFFPFAFVNKLFRKKGFRINMKHVEKDYILKKNDRLKFFVEFGEEKPEAKSPQPPFIKMGGKSAGKIDILFENEDFAVLNKPAGIAVMEWTDVAYEDTFECALKQYFKEKNEEIFLVHRLDKDTSGCFLIAKNLSTKEDFEKMFRENKVKKEYLTLVKGIMKKKKGTIEIKLKGRSGSQLVDALTFYEVRKIFVEERLSLVKVKIKTGRMHQIRLHFSKIGHPVIMDKKYGDFTFNKSFEKKFKLRRQFLHSERCSFDYKNEKYGFIAPLPKDLNSTLDNLMA